MLTSVSLHKYIIPTSLHINITNFWPKLKKDMSKHKIEHVIAHFQSVNIILVSQQVNEAMLAFSDTILFLPAVIICSDVILIPVITLYKITNIKNKHLQHFSIQSDTFYRNRHYHLPQLHFCVWLISEGQHASNTLI